MYSRLQYISQGVTAEEQLKNIQSALDAGCDWIQLRFKNASDELFIQTAETVRALCTKYNATFIINDRVAAAIRVNADGVHLGLADMPVPSARLLLEGKIIGGTANTFEDVLRRAEEKADYTGLGPLRFTGTKEKLSPILGIEGFKNIIDQMKKQGITVPVYAIGGIVSDDLPALLDSGCYGVAVSGAITSAADQKNYVSQLKTTLNGYVEHSR